VNSQSLQALLEQVGRGEVSIDQAIDRLRRMPFEQLPHATLDHHRAIRCGHPEVVFCQGKTAEQVVSIVQHLSAGGQSVLGTRASDEQQRAVQAALEGASIDPLGRTLLINPPDVDGSSGAPPVLVICAGTADLPVAQEAMTTLRSMGVPAHRITDVGVSGLHRLLAHVELLQRACAIVVVAGMEGALPSVVGGLVACPVFAVPTSVGYGASFGGLSALLTMLNSCAANIATVNIDNGFGGAFSAALVYKQVTRTARAARDQR
jgi:NCAIR mutase (PurE)-related protein